jgi:RsiW-degrading membrane proteinase PrsW (M82 family)
MSNPPPPDKKLRYFHTDGKEVFGPFDSEAMLQLEVSGQITHESLVCLEGSEVWLKFSELTLSASPPPLPQPSISVMPLSNSLNTTSNIAAAVATHGSRLQDAAIKISKKVAGDISDLRVPLLLPIVELRSLAWLKNKTALGMMIIGLFPLCAHVFLINEPRLAYWALAFYFSAIWGLYFYGEFAPPNATKGMSLICFFGTGIFSIAILLSAYSIPPLDFLLKLTESDALPIMFFGMLTSVAIPEEVCKALILIIIIYINKTRLHPNTLLFYGLISGLGFGIYEGVDYQMGRNLKYSDTAPEYYLLNMLRITSLPFIHAVWTGIAGYFLGLSCLYPSRKHGLIVLAILIPSLFHAIHNTMPGYIKITTDAIAVLALLVYMSKSQEFEKVLSEDKQNS